MIFHRQGLNQRGFMLIELLLALVISGLISGGIAMSIFQVLNMNDCISRHIIAITQVENAGYRISRDAKMAQSIITGTGNLTLAWGGWEYEDTAGNTYINTYEVSYIYDYDGSELRRHQAVATDKYDSSGHFVESTTPPSQNSVVAKHITAFTPMPDNKLLITAEVGGIEEERTYEITPRPN